MKVVIFDNLIYDSTADLVTCPHCENMEQADVMLVPSGMNDCPICGDNLMWYDDDPSHNMEEISLDAIPSDWEIIHMKADYKEIFDEETGDYKTVKI